MKLCNQCQRPMEEGCLLRSGPYGSRKLEPGRPKPGGIRAAVCPHCGELSLSVEPGAEK